MSAKLSIEEEGVRAERHAPRCTLVHDGCTGSQPACKPAPHLAHCSTVVSVVGSMSDDDIDEDDDSDEQDISCMYSANWLHIPAAPAAPSPQEAVRASTSCTALHTFTDLWQCIDDLSMCVERL